MAFKFAARTLLELGKELISSDEVALNELVKNAVDAGSPSVLIAFNVVLTHGHFQQALEALKERKSPDTVLAGLERNTVFGAPEDARHQFLESLKAADRTAKSLEAALMLAYVKFNWIEVRDQGHGMSKEDLDDIYLTVGTRSRRKDNIRGAEYLGDKGVGRLSAMRLGETLDITTTRNGERHFNELSIDWSRFGHDVDAEVGSIPIAATEGDSKPEPTVHGTIVRISGLASDWSKDRLNALLTGAIARMIDPFEPGKANSLLKFQFNEEPLLVPSIPRKLLDAAHATCTVSLKFEGDEPILDGEINYRLRNAKRSVNQRGVEVYSITQKVTPVRGKKGHASTVASPIHPDVLRALGPLNVEVYWFNRLIVEAVEGLTAKTKETREQIARWSGGPMLYRYGFRVLPYGDPDDDWLELDKRAFGAAGFKLNRQQVIGRITITSKHTALSEQTNREGLVDSPVASALKSLLMWLLHVEMRQLINDADDAELLSQRKAETVAQEFRATESKVKTSLAELRANLPASASVAVDRLDRAVSLLADQAGEIVSKAETWAKESAEGREKFVHLAGIGLMTEFIFHELDRSVKHAIEEIQEVRKTNPRSAVLKNLEDQLTTLYKRVAAFDALTGEKRQVKSNLEVGEVVAAVLEGHKSQFAREHIDVHVEQDRPLRIRAVRGMLIQILENMISNSVYWLRQQVAYEPDLRAQITISISANQKLLSVSDNGPGVDPERKEVIFHPFVTSKPAQQGRGLGLYISRELADYHDWRLLMDEAVGTIRPKRLNTFILELGGEK